MCVPTTTRKNHNIGGTFFFVWGSKVYSSIMAKLGMAKRKSICKCEKKPFSFKKNKFRRIPGQGKRKKIFDEMFPLKN